MTEKLEIEKAIYLIETAGKRLNMPSPSIARAMVIYHHFKRCVDMVEYEDGLTAAAAIGLSIKVDELSIDREGIVLVLYSMFHENKCLLPGSDEFKELEENLTKVQCFVCRMLKFTLNHEIAHKYLVYFLKALQSKEEFQEKWSDFVSTVWKVVTTAYLVRRCLDIEASDIAVACIYIACSFCKISIAPNDSLWKTLSSSMNENKLKEVVSDLLAVCAVSNAGELPVSAE